MCFIKRIKKIESSVQELTNIIKTQELERLRETSKDYDTTKELLSHVKLKIKDVKVFDGEELGTSVMRITYKAPVIMLKIDENGEPNKDEFFYSANMLEMVDIDDMLKVQNELNKLKIKKN